MFLPNYWPGMDFNSLQTHHLNHNKSDNRWMNLVLVPASLHFWLNKVDCIWFFTGKQFRRRTPYEIQKKTGLSLEEIILPLQNRDPDEIAVQGGKTIKVYDIDGYFVGFQMMPEIEDEN